MPIPYFAPFWENGTGCHFFLQNLTDFFLCPGEAMAKETDVLIERLGKEPAPVLLSLIEELCREPETRERAEAWCFGRPAPDGDLAASEFMKSLERLFEAAGAFADPDGDEGSAEAVYERLDEVTRLGQAPGIPFPVRRDAARRLLAVDGEVSDELGILDYEAFGECARSLCRTEDELKACFPAGTA